MACLTAVQTEQMCSNAHEHTISRAFIAVRIHGRHCRPSRVYGTCRMANWARQLSSSGLTSYRDARTLSGNGTPSLHDSPINGGSTSANADRESIQLNAVLSLWQKRGQSAAHLQETSQALPRLSSSVCSCCLSHVHSAGWTPGHPAL